ncbi:MAG TPA: hypothetical protein O0Y08_00225 [Methanocorpusculum sp.]|nr:hypothetical protein [Candidatus Methanocorpusculum equi]MCQ2357347.1 hypothetical protein [Methanocorpusculum sp.]HJJ44128.1 hypothetical protein [Methanocorpusculum sp.]HJJ57924.1 hypothetical protein [Methanocorpusculum sp.]HJJ59276.1 hypothetical protein [Methanocorpusculum sp.]
MTYINEVVKLVQSEFTEKNASAALSSIAERAAAYPSVIRRNQLSKVCMHTGTALSATKAPVRKETYIIC